MDIYGYKYGCACLIFLADHDAANTLTHRPDRRAQRRMGARHRGSYKSNINHVSAFDAEASMISDARTAIC